MTASLHPVAPSSIDFVPYAVEVMDQNDLNLPIGTVLHVQGALSSMLKFENHYTQEMTYIRRALVRRIFSCETDTALAS